MWNEWRFKGTILCMTKSLIFVLFSLILCFSNFKLGRRDIWIRHFTHFILLNALHLHGIFMLLVTIDNSYGWRKSWFQRRWTLSAHCDRSTISHAEAIKAESESRLEMAEYDEGRTLHTQSNGNRQERTAEVHINEGGLSTVRLWVYIYTWYLGNLSVTMWSQTFIYSSRSRLT